jgi:peroxiredoxin
MEIPLRTVTPLKKNLSKGMEASVFQAVIKTTVWTTFRPTTQDSLKTIKIFIASAALSSRIFFPRSYEGSDMVDRIFCLVKQKTVNECNQMHRHRMSLFEQIRELQSEFMKQAPEKVALVMQGATQKLVQSGIEQRCLKVGDKIPPFTLPNATGEMISSETLLAHGPLVIDFYRGGWCPYCNLELKALQDALADIEEQGAQLVAISPNIPDESLNSIEKHALVYEVLSDIKNNVARQFGLVYVLDERLQGIYKEFGIDIPAMNNDESYEIPIPATYVIDKEGIVVSAFAEADYTKREEPSKVIETLKKIG